MSGAIELDTAVLRGTARQLAGGQPELAAIRRAVRDLPAPSGLSDDTALEPALAAFRAACALTVGVLAEDAGLCARAMARAADRWDAVERAAAGARPGGKRPT